jgi:hypothetical protein
MLVCMVTLHPIGSMFLNVQAARMNITLEYFWRSARLLFFLSPQHAALLTSFIIAPKFPSQLHQKSIS